MQRALVATEALTRDERVRLFDTHLTRLCAITTVDAGLEESDVLRYVEDASTEDQVIRAVIEYADDYDLDLRGRGWVI